MWGRPAPELRVVDTQNQTPKLEKENYFSGHAWRSLSGSQLGNRVRRLQSQKKLCQVSSHPSVPPSSHASSVPRPGAGSPRTRCSGPSTRSSA